MKKKLLRFLLLAQVFFLPSFSFACGFNFVGDCPTALFFDINGTRDSFFVGPCSFGTQYHNLRLGTLKTLNLKKITGTTWESCVNNVTSMQMYYRLYPTANPGGAFDFYDLPQFYSTLEGPYTTRYRKYEPNRDLLAGLPVGVEYTFEIYFRAEVDTVGDDFIPETEIFQNNYGENFKITFTNGGPSAPPFSVVVVRDVDVKCSTDSTGVAGVLVYGDQQNLFYSWSPFGSNFFTQFNLPPATYVVTVTGTGGYAQTASIQITAQSNISNQMTALEDVGCNGSPGAATANPTGGLAPYQFAWNSGETTAIGHFPTPGFWWLTVTDARGCTKEFFAEIGGSGGPFPEKNIAAQICSGSTYSYAGHFFSTAGNHDFHVPAADGSCDTLVHLALEVLNLTKNVSAQTCSGRPYTYGNQTFSAAGNYTFTVPAVGGGCDTTIHLALEVFNFTKIVTAQTCSGRAYSYGNQTFNTAGNYIFTVPAVGGGCDTTILLALETFTPEKNLNAEICLGGSYTYGSEIFNSAGDYTFTIPASNGSCDTTIHLKIKALDPSLALAQPLPDSSITCARPLVEYCGEALPGVSFFWKKDGETLSNLTCFEATSGGTYTVVAQLGDCFFEKKFSLVEHTDLPDGLGTGSGEITCGTDTLTLQLQAFSTAENPVYQWVAADGWTSNEAAPTYQTHNLLQLDSLKLFVTNEFGCTAQVPVQLSVTQNTAVPAVHLLSLEPTCVATWQGAISITGGLPPYSLKWSNPTISGLSFNLPSGEYTVTVTGLNGCSVSTAITLQPLDTLSASLSPALPHCNGTTSLAVLPAGGVQPYKFEWSDASLSGSQNTFQPGEYEVTVSDAIHCFSIVSVKIQAFDTLKIALDVSDATGPTTPDGGIQLVVVSGGSAGMFFEWSNGSGVKNLADVPPGVYCVTATGPNGCSQVACAEVSFTIGTDDFFEKNSLKISPNPAFNQLKISGLESGELGWQIFDRLGRQCKTGVAAASGGDVFFNVEDLPEGVFWLKIETLHGARVGKFLKLNE